MGTLVGRRVGLVRSNGGRDDRRPHRRRHHRGPDPVGRNLGAEPIRSCGPADGRRLGHDRPAPLGMVGLLAGPSRAPDGRASRSSAAPPGEPRAASRHPRRADRPAPRVRGRGPRGRRHGHRLRRRSVGRRRSATFLVPGDRHRAVGIARRPGPPTRWFRAARGSGPHRPRRCPRSRPQPGHGAVRVSPDRRGRIPAPRSPPTPAGDGRAWSSTSRAGCRSRSVRPRPSLGWCLAPTP